MTSGQMMDFPNTFDEFVKDYGFKDKQEVYTNGSELIPVFRVKQWLEHISTTKNDLTVDCISREQAKVAIRDKFKDLPSRVEINTILNKLPSVTPQLSSELEKNSQKLEKNFGESDCISRAEAIRVASGYCHPSNVAKELAKLPSVTPQPCEDAVSRQEVLDLIADYDLSMGQVVRGIHALPSVTPQEPFKPMVEIDLDYVIKQKYIEREVLDKIRTEIEQLDAKRIEIHRTYHTIEREVIQKDRVLEILDKYKTDKEQE